MRPPPHIVAVWLATLVVLALAVVALAAPAWAASPPKSALDQPSAIDRAGLQQKLDSQVPTDLTFRNSKGERVELGRYFDGERPVILALGYVDCPHLCSLVHEEMIKSLEKISLDMGEDYRVLSVSIDPDEPLDLTQSARQRYLQMYGRDGASDGWHSLVGDKPSIARLAESVGFDYAYDAEKDQYAHPGAIMVLTPDGSVSRYFFGVDYPPNDVKLGLLDASEGSVGSPVDRVLMRCFHYDPKTGKYSVAIMNVMRLAGGATVLVLALGMLVAFRRRRRGA
ncbi:SCO family protein [Persicimonas caeni]|uniref:SCO family protein n=1 Tax=Persicimonas caeni TaxID=2292766 RepID=A0A4Y6PQC9_PERCE|nr:SCO family protein [Persicimonas caeni]QDG50440.1 SCO family protein [Persicimonas caeni]QED31661.1 SCO family protein [Persicimonas caeni]